MEYYKSNAIYRKLSELKNPAGFVWPDENVKGLVYGNAFSRPRALVLVGPPNLENWGVYYDAFFHISYISRLPTICVCEDKQNLMSGKIKICESYTNKKFKIIADYEYLKKMKSYGLDTKGGKPKKPFNSKPTSIYHIWQTVNFGKITATDIDLIRYSKEYIIEICELKRSIYTLDRWRPFKNDYPNFELLSNLAAIMDAEFNIIYNRRIKNPYYDNISELSVFNFKNRKQIRNRGRYFFDEFLAGKYLYGEGRTN